MKRSAFVPILFSFVCLSVVDSQEEPEVKRSFASPDGRFALKVNEPNGQSTEAKFEVIDNASGRLVGELGTDYASTTSHMKVVWSADSKRLAYRSAGQKEWHTSVAFWNGAAFKSVNLPEDLPSPEIKFRKDDEAGGVKNYGGGEEPVRWRKSGDLELMSEHTEMARESGRTYTATITIIIGFDAQHHPSVKSVSKSKTTVDN